MELGKGDELRLNLRENMYAIDLSVPPASRALRGCGRMVKKLCRLQVSIAASSIGPCMCIITRICRHEEMGGVLKTFDSMGKAQERKKEREREGERRTPGGGGGYSFSLYTTSLSSTWSYSLQPNLKLYTTCCCFLFSPVLYYYHQLVGFKVSIN